MSTMVFGWGGVKLELVSAGLSVVFPANRAYCSQPKFVPEGWDQKTMNNRHLQETDGYWVQLTVFFENAGANDYLLFEDLVAIINQAKALGEAIRVYPKWNAEAPSCIAFDCILLNAIDFQDASQKAAVGQRIPDMLFESEYALEQMPFFTEGALIPVLATDTTHGLGTDDGKGISI